MGAVKANGNADESIVSFLDTEKGRAVIAEFRDQRDSRAGYSEAQWSPPRSSEYSEPAGDEPNRFAPPQPDPRQADIEITPSAEGAETPEPDGGYISAATLRGKPIPPRRWHVPDFIPARTVTTLSGDGGTGKSLAALQLAVATAVGGSWFGQSVTAGQVLYLSAEDDLDELHRRLADIVQSECMDLSDLDNLTIRCLAGHDALMSIAGGPGNTLISTPLFTDVSRWVRENEPALIVLDTLADLFGGDEVNRGQARQFIGMLRGLALYNDATVLLLAHPSLSGMSRGDGNSGSTAWNNSVRSRLYFRRVKSESGEEPDPDARELEVMKANYSGTGSALRVRWQEGVFVPEVRSEGMLDQMAANSKAERVFLSLLRSFTEQGRRVNPNGGTNYAPKVFAEHPDSEGCTKAAFRHAMEGLLAEKKVRVEESGPPSRVVSSLVIGGAK